MLLAAHPLLTPGVREVDLSTLSLALARTLSGLRRTLSLHLQCSLQPWVAVYGNVELRVTDVHYLDTWLHNLQLASEKQAETAALVDARREALARVTAARGAVPKVTTTDAGGYSRSDRSDGNK